VGNKKEGTRLAYPRSAIGEPAEYERVMKGIARQPQAEQRWVSINGDRHTMTLDFYNCDTCNAEIRPGEPAGCWSVWTEEQAGRIPDWEQEYIR
jgi:hypothetical protein